MFCGVLYAVVLTRALYTASLPVSSTTAIVGVHFMSLDCSGSVHVPMYWPTLRDCGTGQCKRDTTVTVHRLL
jgi:hypothetical protein